MRILSLSALLCMLLTAVTLAYAGEPEVELFSPQGVVKGVRQVRVRFSEQMVTFGDFRAADPFDIKCPQKGRGRWADAKNWIYDFEKDVPAGVGCEFSLRPDLKTLSGQSLSGVRTFVFSTGGPAVIESYPGEGWRIDEDQIFVLYTDAEPTDESVVSRVWCSIEDINERVGVRVLGDDEKEKIIGVLDYREPPSEFATLVQCRRHFPNDRVVKLVWGKGVSSASGVRTTEDQTLTFRSRSPFTARLSCERENKDAGCIPLLPMTVEFSAPVSRQEAEKIVLRNYMRTYSAVIPDDKSDYVYSVSFEGPFPENMQFLIEMPDGVKDDAGRELFNKDKFPLKVNTGRYPPLAKFAADFGILEKDDPFLPITVRNIEAQIRTRLFEIRAEKGTADKALEDFEKAALGAAETLEKVMPEAGRNIRGVLKGKIEQLESETEILKRFSSAQRTNRETSLLKKDGRAQDIDFPKLNGEKAFEVIGIPLKKPGFYIVEVESLILGKSLLGKPQPMYVSSAALVTNLSVHFKRGRENSLVWVTALNTGEPVKDVSLNIRDCKGKVLWEGRSGPDGTVLVKNSLPVAYDLPRCSGAGGLFVFAKTEDDMSFVNSEWTDGIEPWRFQLPMGDYSGPLTAHTVLDRPLFRAGELVHMKHIIRKRTSGNFSLVKPDELPGSVKIEHYGTGQTYVFPLRWDSANGIAENTWAIPKEAKLGNYAITLAAGKKTRYGQEEYGSGSFRVEEYKVPIMKGSIQPVSEPVVDKNEIEADLQVSYLSGGGAQGLPVRLRSQTGKKFLSFDDYEGFTFSNGEVREGKKRTRRGEEYYDEGEGDAISSPDEDGDGLSGMRRPEKQIHTVELTLGEGGSARAKITGIPRKPYPQEAAAEMEFRDPNGQILTVSRKIDIWPSRIITGIKMDSWEASAESFKFHLVALDLKGKPLQNVDMKAELFQKAMYSHRRRLMGGFYSYEHMTETKKTGPVCEGKTDSRGLLFCEAKSPVSGSVIIQAKAIDADGKVSVVNQEAWIAGRDDWWFDASDSDRIDVLPERKKYEPGEKAKFQVRMPFRRATALVTVEREGILDTYVMKLSGKEPVIEIPVKKNYAPNVFVSVLCVRGRVAGARPTALVDLAKPAYKLGIGQINVGWRANELKVKLSSDAETYKVRGKARVKISVKKADGSLFRGGEVALAAVDEGLLELMPNTSWNLLESMMKKRGYEVITATAQMHVVGKRHFGLKALPQGGGGGHQATRELFDTLLFWKGRVSLDKNGEAQVEIPINDSLTSFRIVAVATAGADRFGTGQANIRTSQDVMLFSGLPDMVREGDDFKAGFTVRNASGRKMTVEISAGYSAAGTARQLEKIREELDAGQAKEVGWDVRVPFDAENLEWEVLVNEVDGEARDSFRVKQKVAKVTPQRVIQATLFQLEREHGLTVEKPKDAIAGRGGISISLRPRLSDEAGGIVEYMGLYPYTCMEQKVSKAIALKDDLMWKSIMRELPSYMDSDGLVKYFPSMMHGSEVLTAYILSISHEAGRELPADAKDRMEGGLAGFIEGRIVRYSALPTADLSIRKLGAAEALSRGSRFDVKFLDSVVIEPNLWPTSAVLDWYNVLSRSAAVPDRERKLAEAEQIIRSRLSFQGTSMGFSTEKTDRLWWLMVSTDSNAVRTVISFLNAEKWKEDMPRLLHGAVGRQHKGHWSTTTANAWGILALEKFSKKFEAVPVKGTSVASLNSVQKSLKWAEEPSGGSLMFGWPEGEKTLDLSHKDQGRPWVTVRSLAAIPLKEPVSTGYRLHKSIVPVLQNQEGRWSVGDVVRVRLDIEAQSDMTWVVVNDPVPSGATILGTGLGRDSSLLTQGEDRTWLGPVFEERATGAFRAYYEYMPKGRWTVEYTMRLNNEGIFRLPETRAEALYVPEMFGELPNKDFRIEH
ncbi:MAG: MG2 domain-containing protein [Nitrospirota bacterium]|nr:MG2 domain-containing protein [Nitrospirota bacterium]